MISGYYCSACGQDYLSHLKTGELLATSDQSGRFQIHTSSRPLKPTNGIFFNTGAENYKSGARKIGYSGIIEVEMGGGVSAYLNFGVPIGGIEFSGVGSGDSSLGKAVLINNPVHAHWFPATGFGSASGDCSNCGTKLF